MSGPAAGWYDDPSSAQHSRWWDGERWTDHTRLVTAQPVLAGGTPTSPTGPPPPSPTPVAPGTGAAAWSNRPTGSADVPNEPPDRGDALAIASLVSGMLWLFWLGSIAAIVTGIMALRRKVTGGHQAMAVIGIVLGGLSFLGAPVLAAVAVPVFLDQRDAATEAMTASAVRNAAIEMEMAYTTAGRYPTGSLRSDRGRHPCLQQRPRRAGHHRVVGWNRLLPRSSPRKRRDRLVRLPGGWHLSMCPVTDYSGPIACLQRPPDDTRQEKYAIDGCPFRSSGEVEAGR
jgi:hypothetical protein